MAERNALGRWQKGSGSPNPGGRPRGRGLLAELERALAERVHGSQKTKLRALAELVTEMALGGDLRAAELIFRRLAPERLALEGESGLPMLVVRNYTGIEWEEEARQRAAVIKDPRARGSLPELASPPRLKALPARADPDGDDPTEHITVDL